MGLFEIAPTGGITTFPSLVPGSYTITETTNADYEASAVSDNGAIGSDGIVTVDVGAEKHVTCVFTNTRHTGVVTFTKIVSGGALGPGSWSFDVSGPEEVSGVAHGSDVSLATGTYTVSETGPTSYTLSAVGRECYLDADQVTHQVTEAGGECVITNTRQTGSIELRKVWEGASSETTLKIGSVAGGKDVVSETVTAGGTTGVVEVETGTYYVSETDLPDYDGDLSCYEDAGEVAVGPEGGVTVGDGDQITCVFTNTRYAGVVTFTKIVDGGALGPGSWSFDVSGPEEVTGIAPGSDVSLATGTYRVSETGPTSYTLSAVGRECYLDADQVTHQVTEAGGECVITNTRQTGSIELRKAWEGVSSETTLRIGSVAGGEDVVSETVTADGTTGMVEVETSIYHVSETDLPDYDTELSCYDDAGDVAVGLDGAVTIGDGDLVTCVFTNTHVGASLTLSPESAINIAGESQVLTATLRLDTDGDGIYEETPHGETIGFTQVGDGSLRVDNCVTSTGGWCTVTLEPPSGAGSATVQAHWDGNVGSATLSADSKVSKKTWIDATIGLHPFEAVNEVDDPHTITATVQTHDGVSWSDAPDGTVVTFTLSAAEASFIGGGSCATSDGQCSVAISASAAARIEMSAETDVSVAGVLLHRESDGSAGNSGPATKTYVDASIGVTPDEEVAGVGESGTFTVTVTQDEGHGSSPVQGVIPAVSISPEPDAGVTDNCSTTGTDESGQCTVTMTSTLPGTFTADASVAITVGGVPMTRSTATDSGPDGSGPATRTYVDGSLVIGPQEGVNGLGDPHTFTITATASGAAPESWVITPTVTGGPTRSDTCDSPSLTADGMSATCTVVITSSETGVFTATAAAEEIFGETVLHLETDGIGGNSGPARKTYAVPSIIVDKTANPTTLEAPGGQITFDIAVQNSGLTEIELTDLVDDIYGGLDGRGTCVTGRTILPGDSYECIFTADVTVDEERSEVDTVTATVQDEYGQEIVGSDTATVTFISEQVPIGCVRVLKVNDDHEPLAGWTIHARPSDLPGPERKETTDASGWVTFTLAADQTWTFWEEMQDGWEPVKEPQLQLWVEETFTDCTEARFQNRRTLPYSLYLPVVLNAAPGLLQVVKAASATAVVSVEALPGEPPDPPSTPMPGCIEGTTRDDLGWRLPGWVINAEAISGTDHLTATADGMGHYAFDDIPPGTDWQGWEEDQAGWTPLTPREVLVTLEPDAEGCAWVDFVNQQGARKPYLPVLIKDLLAGP